MAQCRPPQAVTGVRLAQFGYPCRDRSLGFNDYALTMIERGAKPPGDANAQNRLVTELGDDSFDGECLTNLDKSVKVSRDLHLQDRQSTKPR